jgi:uncharacterized protein with PQ loop repeat
MSSHALSNLCGLLGTLFNFWGAISQFARVRSVGVDGVSLGTWSRNVLITSYWVAYGIHMHGYWIIIGAGCLVPVQAFITWKLSPWKHLKSVGLSLATLLLFSIAPMFLWGWAGGVFGTGIAMVINLAPQINELLRDEDVSGVSATTYLAGFIGIGVWFIYYLSQHNGSAMFSNGATSLTSLAVALLTFYRRNHGPLRSRDLASAATRS